MKDKDKYFISECVLTLCLLYLIVFLLRENLPIYYKLIFLSGLICGFYFSWLNRKKTTTSTGLLAIGVLAISAWTIYSIFNSSFLYKEVIVIFIKGAFLLEIFLSFFAYLPRLLDDIQALSAPLFMCFPLFIKSYDGLFLVLILSYLICWFIILKVKFYKLFHKPINEINFNRNYPSFLLIIIFIISLACAGLFSYKFPIKPILRGGFFVSEFTSDYTDGDTLEDEYYSLQDKIQKEISESALGFKFSKDSHAILNLLEYLLKDYSTVQEVEKANAGLISLLKQPGPGLEKAKGDDITYLLNNYVDKKASYNLRKVKEGVAGILKNNSLQIKERITIPSLIDKIQNSESLQQVSENMDKLQESIDGSTLGNNAKLSLKELANQLKEWKTFQIRHRNQVISPEITPEITPDENMQPVLEEGQPEALKEDLKIESPDFNVSRDMNILMAIILGLIIFVVLSLVVLFSFLYFLTQKQKNRLVLLYENPREFIINLYENLKGIFTIFGVKHEGFVTPIIYAQLIQDRYLVKNDEFLKLTNKFEEAKYSKHFLQSNDANLALEGYNNILNKVCISHGKFFLLFRYFLSLLHKRPFFIHRNHS